MHKEKLVICVRGVQLALVLSFMVTMPQFSLLFGTMLTSASTAGQASSHITSCVALRCKGTQSEFNCLLYKKGLQTEPVEQDARLVQHLQQCAAAPGQQAGPP